MKDSFNREINYLRLSVTELCNLRCRYCMPETGICKKTHEEMLTEDEMISAVRASASLGVNKVRITGGEPLVKKNILSICRRTAEVEGINEVCITTNGVLLPELAVPLRDAGVKRLNISLDTLDEKKYSYITRWGKLDTVLIGLETALSAGFERIKINTVLIGGFNDNEIPAIADLSRKYPVDVRFIELMPMYDSGDFGPEAFIPGSTITDKLPELEVMPEHNGVATMYRFPDGIGNVGIIHPVSNHFCGECNRLRITADGKIKPCLHSSAEYSLKGLTEPEMKDVISRAILHKPEHHAVLSADKRSESGRNMNEIGG